MSRKSAATGRFMIEILVPPEEPRPSSGGIMIAVEEGLRRRGYQVLVRSVTPVEEGNAWCNAESSDTVAPHTVTLVH